MVLLFWLSALTILYTFLGYPLLVWCFSRWRPRPVKKAEINPKVTLLICAYNEAEIIAQKLRNSLEQDYPAEQLEVAVVADGSTDETTAVVTQFADQGVALFFDPPRRGKNAAVTRVMPYLQGEIIIVTDANALLTPTAVRALVDNFADPDVAAVSGAKQVSGGGEGLYWRYESFLKRCDSALSSVMGAAGELFAFRRALYHPLEPDTIIEDFVISMRLVGRGYRVVYEAAAVAVEAPSNSVAADWERRVRNAAGGFQAIRRLPELLHPRLGIVAWQYLSHRVLRWAVTPFLIPILFFLNWSLRARPFYRLLFWGQIGFYGLGLLGFLRADPARPAQRSRPEGWARVIFYFCLTNAAAIAGFYRFITNRQSPTWKKVR